MCLNISYYYTLYSLSVFSLAKNLQLILNQRNLKISYLLADYSLICRLRAQCTIQCLTKEQRVFL